jgi:hypothetical protein
MCKEMPVILVSRVVGPKRIIGKIGGPRRRKKGFVALAPYLSFASKGPFNVKTRRQLGMDRRHWSGDH